MKPHLAAAALVTVTGMASARAQLVVDTFAGQWPGDNVAATTAWLNYSESISVATDGQGQPVLFITETHGSGLRRVAGGNINTLVRDWSVAAATNPGGTTVWYSTGDRIYQRGAGLDAQAVLVAGGGSSGVTATPRSRVRLGWVERLSYDERNAALLALDDGVLIQVKDGLTSKLATPPGPYGELDVDADGTIYLTARDEPSSVYRLDRSSGLLIPHAGFTEAVFPMAHDATTGCILGRGESPAILEACGGTTRIALELASVGLTNDNVRIDVDRAGNLYVLGLAGVVVLDKATRTTRWLVGGPLVDVAPVAQARFLLPGAVCRAGTTMYVPDTFTATVMCIDTVAGQAARCAGTVGVSDHSFRDGPARDATFDQVSSCAAGRGGVYLGEGFNSTVRLLHDGLVTTVVGVPQNFSLAIVPDGTPALMATFSSDRGYYRPMVENPATGELVVSDPAHNAIYKVTPGSDGLVNGGAGEVMHRLAGKLAQDGTGVYACGAENLPARDSPLAFPVNAAFGPDGSLYFSDSECGRIRKIKAMNGVITDASTISTVAGPRENNPHRSGRPDHREFGWFQFADGASADARFAWPMGIAYRDGHLVVADSANHRIREIDLTTGLTTTLAGNGLPLGSIDGQGGDAADDYVTNVAGPAAALPWPVSVDVNAAGEILFVDDTRVVRRLRQ